MKNRQKYLVYLALAVLVSSSLACSLAQTITAVKATPTPTITATPASPAAATETGEDILGALATAQSGGPIFLEFTEAELTSLAASGMGSGEESIQDLQVRLRDGQITITGNVQRSGFDLPLEIVIEPSVTTSGQPRFRIVEASAGPFPLPQEIINQLSQQMENMVMEQFDSNIVLTSISVNDGKISILGKLR